MAWVYGGAFHTAHVSESRVGCFFFFPLESWHLMNRTVYMFVIIPRLCSAALLLSVLGSLEGGEGPGSFPQLAPGRAGLAASCARHCMGNLVGTP